MKFKKENFLGLGSFLFKIPVYKCFINHLKSQPSFQERERERENKVPILKILFGFYLHIAELSSFLRKNCFWIRFVAAEFSLISGLCCPFAIEIHDLQHLMDSSPVHTTSSLHEQEDEWGILTLSLCLFAGKILINGRNLDPYQKDLFFISEFLLIFNLKIWVF